MNQLYRALHIPPKRLLRKLSGEKEIYAIACICGGLIYYLCMYLDLPAAPTQFIAACSVILIRILAVRYGISLPALKGETRPAPKEK